MNPIHRSGAALPNFINSPQASDNTGSEPQAKTELKNKAFAARDRAADLLNKGIKARLPKEKIALFLEAREFNQQAHETLATNELSSGKLDREREENQRQGADIAEQLFDIRKRQFELEPRPEQKMQRQKDALDEAELLDAHLQKAGSSNAIKNRIKDILLGKTKLANLANDLAKKLADEASQSTGKEKIEFLRSAKKYTDMAARSIRQLGLQDLHLVNYRKMQYNSWVYTAYASDAACRWMEGLWVKYVENFPTYIATSDVDAVDKQGLSCMEANDYCLEIHQDLYNCCKELLSQTGACKRSEAEIERINTSKADAGQRILMQALDRYIHGRLLLQSQLSPLEDSKNEALEAIRISVEEMNKTADIAFGAFRTIRVFDTSSPMFMAQKREVLPSLIEFCEDMIHRTSWLSKACKSAGVEDEAIYREFQRTFDSILHLKQALEKECENILAIEQPKSRKSRLNKQLASLSLDKEGLARIEKGKSLESGSNPPPATDRGSEQCLIDTRFNGKLIGTSRGDKVAVEISPGKEIEFRLDGEKWVRHEESELDFDDIPTGEQNLRGQRDPAEKARLKISAMVTKTEDEVEKLKNEALKHIGLSNYAAKNDAPFSQSIGIFNLAMDAHQKAMSMIGKSLKRIEQAVTLQPELDAYRNRLQALLVDIENLNGTARSEKLNEIKSNPSGPGLSYLMDEKATTAIRKTIARKKMTGPTVPINKQDFMDEYQADIEGHGTWPPVHAHYRTKDAAIKSATSSHITWETDGEKIRLPVSIHLLERLEKASK